MVDRSSVEDDKVDNEYGHTSFRNDNDENESE